MSDELTTVEESVTKVLLNLMTERVMSERGVSTSIQASSTRGLSTSPSSAHEAGPSRERLTKHNDDLANAKLIPSILSTYLPPPSGAINRDSVPKDFEYVLVTAYFLEEVRAVRVD